tara:strand:- start:261 stop:689 length:429 start_codon:yes stop_codon:yes gene_type:complete
MDKKQKVIFICTGNSCRSQMAEGFLKNIASNVFEVYSAGSNPSEVNPNAIATMQELNIDISEHTSDSIDCYINMGINIVITVCDHANQICPNFPGKVEKIHWSIEDPFQGWEINNANLKNFRRTRDKIKYHIDEFINNLERK